MVIDYFTKWVEATSYASVSRSMVCNFIKKEIICQYGLPERIILDNVQFKIQHHNLAPYRLKMNEAVETANKNVKKIIEKTTETYKDWHEKFPFALHTYHTMVRTSTRATRFFLVYGMEVVLPIEVEIPSLRMLMETKLDEVEWV